MHLPRFISAALLLVPTVLADGAAIVAALQSIDGDTAALNDTVLDWDGGLLGAIPIAAKSATLLSTIHKGTDTVESSADLSPIEAVSVAVATQSLIQDVNTTLTTLIDAKSKFDHILLSPVTLLNLELEKHATDKFSAAVGTKVPVDLASAAEELAKKIDALFDEAISAYKG